MKYAAAIIISVLAVNAAHSATVDVQVRSPDGRAVPDAVVMIDTPRAPAVPIRFPWPYVVVQQNIAFAPHTLIVPVGASVTFPNHDRVRHHVYSFSPAKRFELRLYGREEARSVLFDKPGPVALGCNIHDAMSGFIMVVTTPYAARTDGSGRASIANVPAGAATLRVWHPLARMRDNQFVTPVALPAAGSLARNIVLDLRASTVPR